MEPTPVRIGKKNGQVCTGVEYTNRQARSKNHSIRDNETVVPAFGISFLLKMYLKFTVNCKLKLKWIS